MATEFNDAQHFAMFKGPGAYRTGNAFDARWSEIVLASLRAAGFLDNMVDGLAPPETNMLWLDKNYDPAILKEWNPVGFNWEPVTSQTLFGRLPWRGAWKSSIIYRRADVVSNQGGVWIAAEPSQNRVPGIGAYWDVLIPASVIGSLPFVAKPQASSASIDPSFHSVQLFGSSGFSDGRGGLFIDSNNGSDDTFTSADGRTWYRNSIAIKAGHPEAVANSVMGVQYSLEEGPFPVKDEAGIWSGTSYAYLAVGKTFNAEEYPTAPDQSPTFGFLSFTNNDGAEGDICAIGGIAVARQSNGVVFGANLIARNGAGTTNTKLNGLEIDIQPSAGTTMHPGSIGIAMNMFSIAGPAPVMQIGGLGGGTWANGIIVNAVRGAALASQVGSSPMRTMIDTTEGTFGHAAITLGRGAAQAISFGAGDFGVAPYLYGDLGNNLTINMGSGGLYVIQSPAGAQRFLFDQFGALSMPNGGRVDISGKQVLAAGQASVANASTGTEISTINAILARLRTHGLIEN